MRVIEKPAMVPASGGKVIEEFIGRVCSGTDEISIARMTAPPGWEEPFQTPEFDEWTILLEGRLIIENDKGSVVTIRAGEAVEVRRGETVRYSCPPDSGAVYVSVCRPAFTPARAHRDA